MEPKIAHAPTANAGKLPRSVSVAIELLKGKVTHSDQRWVPPLLILFMGSPTVIWCRGKKIVVASISLKKQRSSKKYQDKVNLVGCKQADTLMGEWTLECLWIHLKRVSADPSSS